MNVKLIDTIRKALYAFWDSDDEEALPFALSIDKPVKYKNVAMGFYAGYCAALKANRAEILTRAANRAEAFYRKDCGGCGEDNAGQCAAKSVVPIDDGCSHVAALRSAIMSDA